MFAAYFVWSGRDTMADARIWSFSEGREEKVWNTEVVSKGNGGVGGSTNLGGKYGGNTATGKSFFQNPTISADNTGFDIYLIKRFAIILQAISSGCDIRSDVFETNTEQTYTFFEQLYPWFYKHACILIRGLLQKQRSQEIPRRDHWENGSELRPMTTFLLCSWFPLILW